MQKQKIPNLVPIESLHLTLINSPKAIVTSHKEEEGKFCLKKYEENEIVIDHKSYSFHVWKMKSGGDCLVMKMSCPELLKRHIRARNCGAEHPYGDWSPHLTISYDCKGMTENMCKKMATPDVNLVVLEDYEVARVENWRP